MEEPTQERKEQYAREVLKRKNQFATPDQIEKLISHVDVHRYFLGESISFPVTWHDAAFSWEELIFRDIVRYLKNPIVLLHFPDLREKERGLLVASTAAIDLLFKLSDVLYHLSVQQQKQGIFPEPTALDAVELYILSNSRWPMWLRKLSLVFL